VRNRLIRLVSLVLREPIVPGQLFTYSELLKISIERLPLSERTLTCLKRYNILTVGEILNRGEYDEHGLLWLRNFGRQQFNGVKRALLNLILNFLKDEAGQSKYEILNGHPLKLGAEEDSIDTLTR
jgi:DNA-directed RNA polymerase alpha subunit